MITAAITWHDNTILLLLLFQGNMRRLAHPNLPLFGDEYQPWPFIATCTSQRGPLWPCWKALDHEATRANSGWVTADMGKKGRRRRRGRDSSGRCCGNG